MNVCLLQVPFSTVALALDNARKDAPPYHRPGYNKQAAGNKNQSVSLLRTTHMSYLLLLHNVALLRHVETVQELLGEKVSIHGLLSAGKIFAQW